MMEQNTERKLLTVLAEMNSQMLSTWENQIARLRNHTLELDELLMKPKYQSSSDLAIKERKHTNFELREANCKLLENVGSLTEQLELMERKLISGESEYKCSLARVEAQVAEDQQLLAKKDDKVRLLEMEVERLKNCLASVVAQMQEKVKTLDKKTAELKVQSTEIASLNKISSEQIEQLAKLKKCIAEMQLKASGNQNLETECKHLRVEKNELSQKVQLVQERESQLVVKLTVAADELSKTKLQCTEEVDSLKLHLSEMKRVSVS